MEAATEKRLVPGYRHVPGNHCGSTALRNLLAFHGLEISEQMAFGLGAGACFFYLALDGESPSRFTNGRTARLEETFVELTGAPLELRTDEDPDAAWTMAREAIDSGRPALVLTDLYYLEHYGKSAHFPGHAVVIAGYDDERAYLSDTAFEELQTTSLASLRQARSAQHPAFSLAGHMFTVPEGTELGNLSAAIPAAVGRAAREMLEPTLGHFQGIPALERLAAEAGDWPSAVEDWQWCARFNYQVIERRGTGGGNFRRMYARFLEEAGYGEAALAQECAARWTGLAAAFHAASESQTPEPALWTRVREESMRVLDAERSLWQALVNA